MSRRNTPPPAPSNPTKQVSATDQSISAPLAPARKTEIENEKSRLRDAFRHGVVDSMFDEPGGLGRLLARILGAVTKRSPSAFPSDADGLSCDAEGSIRFFNVCNAVRKPTLRN
jgi:hypothetical protein